MKTIDYQYFIYGTLVSSEWYKNWKENEDEKFFDDDISVSFSGRDGKHLIIGRILNETNNEYPIVVPELDEVDRLIIMNSVKKNYGLEGEFHYYFIKNAC